MSKYPEMISEDDFINSIREDRQKREARIFELEGQLVQAVEALRRISDEASVPVHTGKNGINFKKMYKGWRKIATSRIDIARATLAKIGEGHE
jgi:hypothetical protein